MNTDISGFAVFRVILESPVDFPLTSGAFSRCTNRTIEIFSPSYFQTASECIFKRFLEEMEDLDMVATSRDQRRPATMAVFF